MAKKHKGCVAAAQGPIVDEQTPVSTGNGKQEVKSMSVSVR